LILAGVRYARGGFEEGESLALRALDLLERTGDRFLQVQSLGLLAKSALARNDPEHGEQRAREALPLALESGGWVAIEIYRRLVEALVMQGRIEDARRMSEFAARGLPEEDAYGRAAWLLAQAAVATASGDREQSHASYSEALRLLEEQRLLLDLAETRLAFARSLVRFGEQEEACAQLEQVRELAARMGAAGLLADAERELRDLEAQV
jgi:ATP/maltotriose-dependent transcriptional regulator MalT